MMVMHVARAVFFSCSTIQVVHRTSFWSGCNHIPRHTATSDENLAREFDLLEEHLGVAKFLEVVQSHDVLLAWFRLLSDE